MLYGILKQKNPDYLEEVWGKLDALYKGGFAIQGKAEIFCPRLPGESRVRYAERLKAAAYINYHAQIVDQLVAGVFEKDFSLDVVDEEGQSSVPDKDFYEDFAHNCDRRGNSINRVARTHLKDALNKGKKILAVDVTMPPKDGEAPSTLADEEAMGVGVPYVYPIEPEELIDWEYNEDNGEFEFCILHRVIAKRAGPGGSRGLIVEEFKVWEKNDVGKVIWTKYRTPPYDPVKGPFPKDDDEIPVFDEGTTTFTRIPLFELNFTDGSLWLGDRVGPLSQEHFQRRTSLNAAENKSLVAIPYAKLGPELGAPGGALPSPVAENPYRANDPVKKFEDQGYLVIGQEDELGFAEPGGACYALVDEQLGRLKDEMFRVVHQIAASLDNGSSKMRASGDSKKQDKSDTVKVLGELAERMRQFLVQIYTFISELRGEKDVEWTVFGLDEFTDEDRATLIQEAMQIDMIPINSPTFKKIYKTDIAARLCNGLSPEDQAQIKKEIEESVLAESELHDTQHEAAVTTAQAEADGKLLPDASSPAS